MNYPTLREIGASSISSSVIKGEAVAVFTNAVRAEKGLIKLRTLGFITNGPWSSKGGYVIYFSIPTRSKRNYSGIATYAVYDVDGKFLGNMNLLPESLDKLRAVGYGIVAVKNTSKTQRKGGNNPRKVLIYAKVNRIIATKNQSHICDADCKRHGHRYYHDFSSIAKMYGLPNGDLLITTR